MALHRVSLGLRHTVACARSLHTSGICQQQEAAYSTTESEPDPFSVFRTQEADPACQTEKHIGQYYTIPAADVTNLFPHGIPWRYHQQIKTFNEATVMVRQPALEVISYLKNVDKTKPVQRFLFYGLKGTGKTMSLFHAIHYCYTQGWLVLHVPDAHLWVKNCNELLPSSFNSARFDQPLQAAEWLQNFKKTNHSFLPKIKIKQRYVWTKREATEEGSHLGELVDQGISRIKSSSDVVGAVFKELRLQRGEPGSDFHLAVAVDGVNALWGQTTIKKEDRSIVDPEELTLVHNLRKLLRNDWVGGAILTSVSQTGSLYTPKTSYLPQELLGEGFDCMDPFLPVSVPNYSEKEFESCYLYYIDRKWLQHTQSRTEEGKKELVFLSNRNPMTLERICASL